MNRPMKNQYFKVSGCKGFTLLEVLVAVLIFSIIIFTLFATFNGFMITSKKITREVSQGEKIRNTLKRICLDLEQLYALQRPRYSKPEFDSDPDPFRLVGEEAGVEGKVFSSVTFSSLSHAKTGKDLRQGVARISYYVKANENNTLDLYRADSLEPYPEEMESCADHLLCEDISAFELFYKDINGDEYRYWDSESDEFKFGFPASVHLKIGLNFQKKNRVFGTAINLISARGPIE